MTLFLFPKSTQLLSPGCRSPSLQEKPLQPRRVRLTVAAPTCPRPPAGSEPTADPSFPSGLALPATTGLFETLPQASSEPALPHLKHLLFPCPSPGESTEEGSKPSPQAPTTGTSSQSSDPSSSLQPISHWSAVLGEQAARAAEMRKARNPACP